MKQIKSQWIDVPEVLNVQMNEMKKMDFFVRDFFKKWKDWISSKENVIFFLGA